MTAGGPATDVADPSPSYLALERYSARLRPRRIGYAALIVVAALVLLVIVKIAYSRGEISAVTLRPAESVPPSAALQTPSAPLKAAWTSTDRTAIGQPYWGGTVVTYDQHTMRGRDARTGRVTWSFTRADRNICQAVQDEGVSIAVFELHGNCDQLTALDTNKGTRKWDRTLDKDGAELNGRPRYAVVPLTLMLTTPHAIYAVDPSSGLDRWVFRQKGCTVHSAVLGSDGALISQTCAGRVCADLKFCGNGDQLVFRDPTLGENTDSATNKNNPDQIKWQLLGNRLVPATADQLVTALSPDGARLLVLSGQKGATVRQLPLVTRTTTSTAVAANDADLLRVGNTTYALDFARTDVSWYVTTAALPTVTGRTGTGTPSLAQALIAVPTPSVISVLDPETGAVQRSYRVPTSAAGSRVYPYGTGFLVAGARTSYYR